jgi:hypothetical protein
VFLFYLFIFVVVAEIDEYYSDVRYERIAILNALGAYYSYLGKIETKQREKEDHFILATQYYNKASRIDMHEPSTWVGKGECLELLCAIDRKDSIGWPWISSWTGLGIGKRVLYELLEQS